jgi:hypothetical protein
MADAHSDYALAVIDAQSSYEMAMIAAQGAYELAVNAAHGDYANAMIDVAYDPRRTRDIKPLNRAFSVADDAYRRALKAASDAYDRALEAASDAYDRALEAASDAYYRRLDGTGSSPTSSQPLRPSPGWYPDPAGTGGVRWWDGTQWTAVTPPPLPSNQEGTP